MGTHGTHPFFLLIHSSLDTFDVSSYCTIPLEKEVYKLHRPVAQAIIHCLGEIIIRQYPADKVIERCFKENPKFGKRDRGTIASNVYDIVRNYVLIRHCADQKNDLWGMLGIWILNCNYTLPAWDEFAHVNRSNIRQRWNEAIKDKRLQYSVPVELDQIGKSELGDRWYREMQAMHVPGQMILRVNTLKSNMKQVITVLRGNEIQFEQFKDEYHEAIKINQRINLFTSDLFKQGFVEVQDYASQQVAHFIKPQSGQRIIDACAGGGGKALHLATLMQNKGRVLALDIDQYKLSNLHKRAVRDGIDIIETKWIENNKVIKRLEGQADILLLDVPCTGSGVIKRNPDSKYRIDKNFITGILEKQSQILMDYCKMTKPGGDLIYCTCSIFNSENRKQVDSFLSNHPFFEFQEERTLWPSEFGYDGFYMARMKRIR